MNFYILNGPEIGRSIEAREGVPSVGHSRDNDIHISDGTVSCKHLRLVIKGDRCFITDLESQNKTYYDGKYLIPGEEVEIVEGAPIAIGMRVICLGERCRDKMAPYLDTLTMITRKDAVAGVFEDRRKRTRQKRGDLINKAVLSLKEDVPLMQMLGEVLGQIFHHLKRIDRGAFVLVDPRRPDAKSVIWRVNKPVEDNKPVYSEKVVGVVLRSGKPVICSESLVEGRNDVVDTLKVLRIKSLMCLPIIGGSEVLGALYLDSLKRPDGFRKDDLLDLLDIAQRIAVTVESDRFAADLLEVTRDLSGKDRGV